MVINNTFHMWYTGCMGIQNNNGHQIGHATSPDGITWTKDPNNPVLTRGNAWDEAWVVGHSVMNDGSKYHMWYYGWGGTGAVQIGHATSPMV